VIYCFLAMGSKKGVTPTKLLWVDLEMTGLVPEQDVILEVAAEITGFDFETIASYESRVQHSREKVLKLIQANPWWKDYPGNRDDFVAGLSKAKPLYAVEKELIALVKEHFKGEPAILAGNSIHSDRAFIKKWMPELDLHLHYRMLDVTSWKTIMLGVHGVNFKKPEVHRAYEDIQASIAEMQYYLDWFDKRQYAAQPSEALAKEGM
jgi:oligoribonuclease